MDPIPPKMVLPPPAPQSELEGLQAGYKAAGEAQGQPVGVHPPNGAKPPVRRDGSSARHPMTKKWTNK